ncbi:MAG: ATP-binding protein [Patescibacteria group bacterium]
MGTGLGLFITRMLLEKMGGKISFSSSPAGTTFSFSLPVKS